MFHQYSYFYEFQKSAMRAGSIIAPSQFWSEIQSSSGLISDQIPFLNKFRLLKKTVYSFFSKVFGFFFGDLLIGLKIATTPYEVGATKINTHVFLRKGRYAQVV